MKNFTILLIQLTFLSFIYGQENNNQSGQFGCDTLIDVITDKMTDNTAITTKVINILDENQEGFTMIAFRKQFLTKKELKKKCSYPISLIIKVKGGSYCIDKGSKVNILFRDGTKFELYNDKAYNCDATCVIDFSATNEKEFYSNICRRKILEMISSKEIESIRVWTSNKFVQKDLIEEQSLIFMNSINCLMNK